MSAAPIECEPMHPDENGWSEWIHPLPGYLMQCCDCGLIHEMEFAIGRRQEAGGPLNEGETKNRVIVFRARRFDGVGQSPTSTLPPNDGELSEPTENLPTPDTGAL